MLTDSEGIVLRKIKTSYNRQMLLLFTKKFGKISAGTSINERGKSKSSLALRPFTYGRYEIFKNRDNFNVNGAEVLKSYYKIGENVDKYMNGAYALEFTEKVLEEGAPAPEIFTNFIDFLNVLENREKGIGTLVLAYQIKVFRCAGVMPEVNCCTVCGKPIDRAYFSVEHGGAVCKECGDHIVKESAENSEPHSLIYSDDFDIIGIIRYFVANPLKKLENMALNRKSGEIMQRLVREYAEYYLDVSDIKSEKLI